VNLPLLRQTWATAAGHGDAFVAWFYGALFLRHPEMRDLFGADMASQRAKIADTLDLVVQGADNLEAVVPKLRRLGRMHRRFGVTPDMFPAVGEALLATFPRFCGADWTPEAHDTWAQAYGLVSGVMLDAYQEAERFDERAVWDVLVVETWRDPAVLHLAVDPGSDYPWKPGAPVDVRLADEAGTWRHLTFAADRRAPIVVVPLPDRLDHVTLSLLCLQPGDHLWLAQPVDHVDQEAHP
jgi:hemoglobin-like flavoprotein